MIKRDFWEHVAGVWAKNEKIEIPEIQEGPDVPDDMFELDKIDNWDDLLKDLLGSDSDEDSDVPSFLFDEW